MKLLAALFVLISPAAGAPRRHVRGLNVAGSNTEDNYYDPVESYVPSSSTEALFQSPNTDATVDLEEDRQESLSNEKHYSDSFETTTAPSQSPDPNSTTLRDNSFYMKFPCTVEDLDFEVLDYEITAGQIFDRVTLFDNHDTRVLRFRAGCRLVHEWHEQP